MKATIVDQYDKKKYRYRMIKINVGKGWTMNYHWGTYAPIADLTLKGGNLYLVVKHVLRGKQ